MPSTPRTQVRRLPERGSYDPDVVRRILAEGLVCHVGFVVDGQPFVIPMAYGLLGDDLILHGSTVSRLMIALRDGAPICVSVTHVDGLVLARSGFHSSMNYRSVTVFGRPRRIVDPGEKRRALDALVEHLIPGRGAELRPHTDKEVAATEVVALALEEAAAKIRTGPPHDVKDDLDLDVWAGVIPFRLEPGVVPAPDLRDGIPVPGYVSGYRRPS